MAHVSIMIEEVEDVAIAWEIMEGWIVTEKSKIQLTQSPLNTLAYKMLTESPDDRESPLFKFELPSADMTFHFEPDAFDTVARLLDREFSCCQLLDAGLPAFQEDDDDPSTAITSILKSGIPTTLKQVVDDARARAPDKEIWACAQNYNWSSDEVADITSSIEAL